jgi:hypothetical protein
MIDLLSRIEQELQERMETLHPAVEECDRLQADLTALDVAPKTIVVTQPSVATDVDFEWLATPEVAPEPTVVPEPPVVPELSAHATRLPMQELPRRRAVSPKVARLMLAPRRPSLERSGARRVRVGAGAGD